MTLNPFKHGYPATEHCSASVGNGVACGRESAPGDSLCTFHRTLFGPWLKAATKRAA
jgi:hypothetical protein